MKTDVKKMSKKELLYLILNNITKVNADILNIKAQIDDLAKKTNILEFDASTFAELIKVISTISENYFIYITC